MVSARLSPFGFVGSISFDSAITPTSVARYVALVERAQRWRKIKALILRINSPGGDAAASEQFFQALRKTDEVKPVYCYVDSMAASGGYYVACAGRRVYAPPNAVIGSIGVIWRKAVLAELLGKLGISLQVLTKGEHKDMFSMHRPLSDEEKVAVGSLMQDVYQQFIARVAERRGKSVDEITGLGTGEVFSSSKSLSLGLIDGLKSYREALEELAKSVGVSPNRVIQLSPHRPFMARLFGVSTSEIMDVFYDRLLRESIGSLLV
jgi:protease-4